MGNQTTHSATGVTHIDIPTSLTGHLLIAMPNLADPNFSGTVSLICEHSESGAMGLVINHPTEVTMAEVFEQMDVEGSEEQCGQPVLSGGPVSLDRGLFSIAPGTATGSPA